MPQITFSPTFAGWQRAARRALAEGFEPGHIFWEELSADQPALGLLEEAAGPSVPAQFRVPREFLPLATRIACHRDPRRWAFLYQALWRLVHGEPRLLEILVDPLMAELNAMDNAIRHDVHKMRAFVRFREVSHLERPWYVAWFEPQHHIVELNAPFFVDRFAGMCWSILTPDRCAHWDSEALSFTAGVPKSEAPGDDAIEGLWITYYRNIFNPARVKTHAMQAEMPKKYWKNLPEAAVIPALLNEAAPRVGQMMRKSDSKKTSDAEWTKPSIPDSKSIAKIREAAKDCTACPLYKNATQTVFGEGPKNAPLVFVGEQPGDSEDRAGHPFIGPAGQLLDKALEEVGIDRGLAYVTNAVKHFKWEPSGKRRLHKKPSARDVASCRPWLLKELELLKPKVLVLLGGTAAQAILGPSVRVLRDRGTFQPSEYCEQTLVTVHPSSLLRAPDEKGREAAYRQFLDDLGKIAKSLPKID